MLLFIKLDKIRPGFVESFLVSKITEIDEKKIQSLSNDINRITSDKIESLIESIQEQIHSIVSVSGFEKQIQ